jgi:membrane protease YdiL (CAAX protease family)
MNASEARDQAGAPVTSTRTFTYIGLAIALFGLPLVVALFNAFAGPRTAGSTLLRELAIFALAAFLVYLIRNRERLGWDSVITILGCAAAIAASLALINLFGLRFGSADAASFDALPTWVMLLVILRAGVIEEFFYRGYAIERLEVLTRSRWLAAVLPLIPFALFHYRQGSGGILIALLTGAVLTAVYLYKRNLWINMTAHFTVDFIPNIILPLFMHE